MSGGNVVMFESGIVDESSWAACLLCLVRPLVRVLRVLVGVERARDGWSGCVQHAVGCLRYQAPHASGGWVCCFFGSRGRLGGCVGWLCVLVASFVESSLVGGEGLVGVLFVKWIVDASI